MGTDAQALALLQRWREQGRLTEAEYQAELAALESNGAASVPHTQTVQTTAAGARSLAVGGAARGNTIITGDVILAQAAQPGASPAVLRQAYLYRLLQLTRGLPLTGVDRKAAEEKGNGEVQLAAVYTGLLTQRLETQDGFAGARVAEQTARRLSAVEMLNRARYLVLLGEPGGGKTTFVNFVALCLAGETLGDAQANLAALTEPLPQDKPRRSDDQKPEPQPWEHGALLPVRVVLRDFVARGLPAANKPVSGKTLWQFIVGELGHAEYAPYFKQELLEHGGLILLDGLDEVPEAHHRRAQVKAAVQGLVNDFPRCRFLVTSRTYAYQRQEWKLTGFAEVVLAPFTPGQVARFVERWYAHIGQVRGWHPDHTQGQAVILQTAIARSERLAELAERPLLLTLMASLHAWREGSLPEKREELYADAVDLLLEQWEGRKVVRDAAGQPVLQQPSLAEWLKVDRAVVRAELERLAFEAHRDQPELKGTADIAQEKLVDALMKVARTPARPNPVELEDYLCQRAGLLAARGACVYAFPHRTFQEYLAACYLTDHGFPRQAAQLLQADPQRWREATLLAGAKAARGTASAAWNLAEALCYRESPATGCAAGEGPECWGALLAAQVLLENEGPRLPRVDAWDAPKLERIRLWLRAIVERGWLPPVDRLAAGNALALLGDDRDFEEMIEIPAGPFVMGEGEEQHQVTLSAYQIGKYPVTVGQFRRFVEASGYKPYDSDCLRGIANHPVVWVNWRDAQAYVAWLRESTGQPYRLPTEAEWEKAARGAAGRIYPWEDDWDAGKCNNGESGLNGTSPVGMYPAGASPYGCLDMAGNVWEWCSTLYESYPYRADDGREDLQASGDRVLRGGAYWNDREGVRCAYRDFDHPGGDYDYDDGFRVARSSFSAP